MRSLPRGKMACELSRNLFMLCWREFGEDSFGAGKLVNDLSVASGGKLRAVRTLRECPVCAKYVRVAVISVSLGWWRLRFSCDTHCGLLFSKSRREGESECKSVFFVCIIMCAVGKKSHGKH